MSVSVPSRLLTATLPVKRHTDDAYGGSWSQVASPKGRVNHTRRLVRDADGNQVVSSSRVYFGGDVDVRLSDRVEVAGVDRDVLAVAQRRDVGGSVAMVSVDLA